jgi:predicted alpha/beta hydrolase
MSGRSSRDKGKRAELAVAAWLRDNGWPAVTTRATSGAQRGDDLVTSTGLSWEVKDHARLELAAWVEQSRRQSGGKPAVVIHKRRGVASPGGWYVTMLGDDLLRILEAGRE